MQMFLYQGTILFEQQKMNNYDDEHFQTDVQISCKLWINLEIQAFYLYIASASIFLFYIQIRGIMGRSDRMANSSRYKQDALQYYDLDIDWFAFIFVMLQLHINGIMLYIFQVKKKEE